MKMALPGARAAVAAALGGLFHFSTASAEQATPTQQVINMLTEMKGKGVKATDDEQKVYFAYKEWAEDRSTTLGFEIKEGAAKIEELVAFIGKKEERARRLGREIAELEAEVTQLEQEKAEATKVRQVQKTENGKLAEDYRESFEALQHAIQVLSSQNYDRAQAEVLLQRMSTRVPGMPRLLASFLQEKTQHGTLRGDGGGAPAVAAYAFQSGGIVQMLKGLFEKFKGELAEVEQAEVSQAHEFQLVELHLSNTISEDTSDRDEKVISKSKKAEAAAKAKAELAEVRKAKAADERLKAETDATFLAKKAAYDENQKVRAGEVKAIAKAIEILSSPEVADSYAKRVNLVQVGDAGEQPEPVASLIQLGRSRHRVSLSKQAKAAHLLAARAQKLGSKELAALAEKMVANPFGKVIDMVESLIGKLKSAAAAEAKHKTWCDQQLKANKLKRNRKTAQVNQLVAEIEEHESSIQEATDAIGKLVEEQADLAKSMVDATRLRESEKEEHLAIIADAKAGYGAVGRAVVVLKEFYAGQKASAFLQQVQVPGMEAYGGMQSSHNGVAGMLEVIQTDFARLRAETEAAEQAAAVEHESFMEDSKASKKAKHKEEAKLRLEKDQTEYENGESKKDLASTEEELNRAKEYFQYLKPNCVEVHVSWEERVARRKKEIAALKEAYAVLDEKS